jgi:hypothetical protein
MRLITGIFVIAIFAKLVFGVNKPQRLCQSFCKSNAMHNNNYNEILADFHSQLKITMQNYLLFELGRDGKLRVI